MNWISNLEINQEEKYVKSSMAFGLLRQTAKYHGPYRGCSLVGKTETSPEPRRPRKPLENPSAPWPVGDAVDLAENEDVSELSILLDNVLSPFKQGNWSTREFVVVYKGKIVYEWAAPGFTTQTPLLSWSMTKTLIASCVGIRISEGAFTLQTEAARWFPEWRKDNRSRITIDDLLTMQSGLQWSEKYAMGGQGEVIPMLFTDESCAERPRASAPQFEPGTHFAYASGTSNLLSEILRSSLKYDESYWTYPYRMLLEPIGANRITLETDRTGTFNAAAFSYGAARDWARVGLLLLNDGVWVNGQRILPPGWLDYVRKPHASSFGMYGAHLWLGGTEAAPEELEHDVHLSDHGRSSRQLSKSTFTLTGYKGQFVSVFPEKDLVVVRMAEDMQRNDYGDVVSKVVKALS